MQTLKYPKFSRMRSSALILLAAGAAAASAAPCPGVTQSTSAISPTENVALSRLAGSHVHLVRTYRTGSWAVYKIKGYGDPGWLFLNGRLDQDVKPFIWGGSASPDEYRDVLDVLMTGAKGVPPPLATCLAHELTGLPMKLEHDVRR